MASRPLIKESLLLLNICGIDPHKSNYWSNARAAIGITLILIVEFNSILALMLHWEGLNSMQVVAISFGIYQIAFKFITALIYGKRFVKVINKMENFWSVDQCSVDLKNKIKKSYNFNRKFGKFFLALLGCMVLAFTIKPGRQLPFKGYYPIDINKSPDYEVVFVLQLIMMPVAIVALLGLDGLFVALIMNITSEIKMLKEDFQKIPIHYELKNDSEETLRYLYRLIDHHNLILECIKDLRKIYNIPLLNVYFYSTAIMCNGLLSIIASGFPPTLESLNQFGTLVIFYAVQLHFFCATGSHLITESESIATVVYDTNWWIKTQPELRRAYTLVIMRANKMEQLMAGGMFTLNLESFAKVIKNTLSLFTLVEAMYKN